MNADTCVLRAETGQRPAHRSLHAVLRRGVAQGRLPCGAAHPTAALAKPGASSARSSEQGRRHDPLAPFVVHDRDAPRPDLGLTNEGTTM